MAFCGNCGTQLNDGAKFCPKCGQPTNQQPYENNNESLNSVSNEENLVTLEKICAAFEELGLSKQIAFGLTGALAVFGILWGFNNMDIKFMVICLLSVAGLYYILKGVIKPKYTWWIAIGTLIIVLIATTTTSNSMTSKFVAVKDGRAAYGIDSAHYEKSDVQSISKIVMYEGNGRKDCKAEGINSEGQLFAVDGKWEKKKAPKSSGYYYYLDYKYFKLLIRDDFLVCYYKGNNDDASSISQAWNNGVIGKIKNLTQEAENRISTEKENKKQEIEKAKQAELSKFLGDYVYSYNIGDTNARLYFKITLNSDGTFTHSPNNETTANMMNMYKTIDGYDYPDGGNWKLRETVAGDAIYLNFDGSWDGSIALDNMVLEIKNMNGYNLKTKVIH